MSKTETETCFNCEGTGGPFVNDFGWMVQTCMLCSGTGQRAKLKYLVPPDTVFLAMTLKEADDE